MLLGLFCLHLISMHAPISTFVLPARYAHAPRSAKGVSVCAILPTYKPTALTLLLAKELLRWNPDLLLVVVDDCTPENHAESAAVFARMRKLSSRLTLLRTPANKLKAGALNFALSYIARLPAPPEALLTLDDDVVIDRTTVRSLVSQLMSYPTVGAVCSQCRVLNKNKNALTRLQGLEYVGFNAIRLADEGFLQGPLVMHGMLTAFKTQALLSVGGFSEGHLIEDYEITARLKERGWDVKAAVDASAWTVVPETLKGLWKQRTRWAYGGITVVLRAKKPLSVLQDLIGHALFLLTCGMIVYLLFSSGGGLVQTSIIWWIVLLSVVQLLVWYTFQLWLMRLYKEKDLYDWIIKASIMPEFIYSNMMMLVYIGSYLFSLFVLVRRLMRPLRSAGPLLAVVERAFKKIGYTELWGSRM